MKISNDPKRDDSPQVENPCTRVRIIETNSAWSISYFTMLNKVALNKKIEL